MELFILLSRRCTNSLLFAASSTDSLDPSFGTYSTVLPCILYLVSVRLAMNFCSWAEKSFFMPTLGQRIMNFSLKKAQIFSKLCKSNDWCMLSELKCSLIFKVEIERWKFKSYSDSPTVKFCYFCWFTLPQPGKKLFALFKKMHKLVKCLTRLAATSLVCVSSQLSISQVQAHMECGRSIFLFQCSFGAVASAFQSALEQLFSSIPPPTPFLFFSFHQSNQSWRVLGIWAHRSLAGISQPRGQYSIWGLGGLSGSPWLPQAPTFHLSKATVNKSARPKQLHAATCNLSKVKIEPMLVEGSCLIGVSGLPLKPMWHHVGCSPGLCASPLLEGHFACFGRLFMDSSFQFSLPFRSFIKPFW